MLIKGFLLKIKILGLENIGRLNKCYQETVLSFRGSSFFLFFLVILCNLLSQPLIQAFLLLFHITYLVNFPKISLQNNLLQFVQFRLSPT